MSLSDDDMYACALSMKETRVQDLWVRESNLRNWRSHDGRRECGECCADKMGKKGVNTAIHSVNEVCD